MYKGEKISLRTFRNNHSFAFIEDEETILRLTKDLLDMPFCKVYHPSWNESGFTAASYPDDLYRKDGLIPEKCSTSIAELSYAESLVLLRADLDIPKRREQMETEGFIDVLLKEYVALYVGYLKSDGSM